MVPVRVRAVSIRFCLGLFSTTVMPETAIGDQFDSYEVRVIRPKFFQKSHRFEIGGQLDTIMNQAFVYSFLATGILSYHFSEAWGLEARGSYGISIEKEDKRILEDEFQINTIILRTQSLASLRLNWTPAYGKFQLESGNIVYFDTFVTAGAGLTGIEYQYDHCRPLSDLPPEVAAEREPPPAANTQQYPTAILGLGQRFFPSQDVAMRLGVDYQQFFYDKAHGSCVPSTAISETATHNNILLGIGISQWF